MIDCVSTARIVNPPQKGLWRSAQSGEAVKGEI